MNAVVLARHNNGVPFVIERLSPGGARLVGPLTLAIGERIQVQLDIGGHPLDLCAEVVAVSHHDVLTDRVAVRFIDIEASSAESIRAAIDRFPSLE